MHASVYDNVNAQNTDKTQPFTKEPHTISVDQPRNTAHNPGSSFSASVFSGLVALFDTVAIFFSSALTFTLYFGWSVTDQTSYLAASIIATLLLISIFYFSGLYQFNSLTHPLNHIKRIIPICVLVFLILVGIAFMLKISETFSRVWVFSWLFQAILLICMGRLLCYLVLLKLARSGVLTRNIAVVGSGEQARRLLLSLNQSQEPWNRVVGIFDDRINRNNPELRGYTVLGTLDDLLEFARQRRIDDVIVTLPWSADQRVRDIISKINELPINIHLGADLAGFIYPKFTFSSISGIPMLGVVQKPKPVAGWNVVVKSLEDRILAALLVLLISPILLAIALAIKLNSKGPVLFKQPRYGFNNKEFFVYKFRTMYDREHASHDARQATRDDPRITQVGKFLRRTSLDELPQLFNVLEGTMSLVGPRPHPVSLNKQYAELIGGYFSRHKVKPGITGWAQVCGHRGETDTADKMQARVEHDVYYIENWSLLFDLQILFMTAFVGFVHKNAY